MLGKFVWNFSTVLFLTGETLFWNCAFCLLFKAFLFIWKQNSKSYCSTSGVFFLFYFKIRTFLIHHKPLQSRCFMECDNVIESVVLKMMMTGIFYMCAGCVTCRYIKCCCRKERSWLQENYHMLLFTQVIHLSFQLPPNKILVSVFPNEVEKDPVNFHQK